MQTDQFMFSKGKLVTSPLGSSKATHSLVDYSLHQLVVHFVLSLKEQDLVYLYKKEIRNLAKSYFIVFCRFLIRWVGKDSNLRFNNPTYKCTYLN